MRKILKSKKAKYFVLYVVVALIIAQVTMVIWMMRTNSDFEKTGKIGQKQLLIFSSFQDAEKTLFYIDMSARWAVEDAFVKTALKGGMPYQTDCQNYLGFSVWDFDSAGQKCLPNKDNLEKSFAESMNENLEKYFKLSPDLNGTIIDYEIQLAEDPATGGSVISGTSRFPLSFDIKRNVVVPGLQYTQYNSGYQPKISGTQEQKMTQIYEKYGGYIQEAIDDAGGQSAIPEITPSLMVALIMQESKGNPDAKSSAGALGLAQFMPATAADYGLCSKNPPCQEWDHRTDPRENIKASVKYLKHLAYDVYGKYKDKIKFALGSYNAGFKGKSMIQKTGKDDPSWEEIITANPNMAEETQRYIPLIMTLKDRFEQSQFQGEAPG